MLNDDTDAIAADPVRENPVTSAVDEDQIPRTLLVVLDVAGRVLAANGATEGVVKVNTLRTDQIARSVRLSSALPP